MTATSATDADSTEPVRPSRPAAVELAAALLIVGGSIGVLAAFATLQDQPAGAEPFVAGTIGRGVASIAIGLLVRLARVWLLALNYAAVLGFLDLLGSGGSPLALMLGLADVLVVLILLANKPWFDAMRAWRTAPRPTARTGVSP